MRMQALRRAASVFFLVANAHASALALADDVGVTSTTVTIGRVTPRGSTAFGAMAEQRAEAADAYFASINARGGIAGRKIVLKDRDDGYSADRAERETQALIHEDKVFALLGAFGSPTLPAVMRVAEQAAVPLVGAASMSNEAREPVKRFVFPVRISAVGEAVAAVKNQSALGVKRFVVLSSKEAYGPAGGAAYAAALKRAGLSVNQIKFEATEDAASVARRLHAAQPETVLVSVVPKPFSAVLREYRKIGGVARIFGLSVIRMEDLRTELGELSTGIALSQVVPFPRSRTVPLVNEYRKLLLERNPAAQVSYHGLEGFLEAKVLVEGLRRAGPNLTRMRFVTALESIQKHDFGGVFVHYAEGDRTGSTFSDMIMIGSNGAIVR